jgi:hypothetical protein
MFAFYGFLAFAIILNLYFINSQIDFLKKKKMETQHSIVLKQMPTTNNNIGNHISSSSANQQHNDFNIQMPFNVLHPPHTVLDSVSSSHQQYHNQHRQPSAHHQNNDIRGKKE